MIGRWGAGERGGERVRGLRGVLQEQQIAELAQGVHALYCCLYVEEEYEYEEKLQATLIEKKEVERNGGSTKGGNKKKVIYGRYPIKNGVLGYTKTKSEREHHISSTEKSGAGKNFIKADPLNIEFAHTPNNVHHKKIFFSSEKVEEDHSEYLAEEDESVPPRLESME